MLLMRRTLARLRVSSQRRTYFGNLVLRSVLTLVNSWKHLILGNNGPYLILGSEWRRDRIRGSPVERSTGCCLALGILFACHALVSNSAKAALDGEGHPRAVFPREGHLDWPTRKHESGSGHEHEQRQSVHAEGVCAWRLPQFLPRDGGEEPVKSPEVTKWRSNALQRCLPLLGYTRRLH